MTGVMIVTGGSRGIGAAIAKLAGQRGYAVAVNYTNRADAAENEDRHLRDRCRAGLPRSPHRDSVARLIPTASHASLGG